MLSGAVLIQIPNIIMQRCPGKLTWESLPSENLFKSDVFKSVQYYLSNENNFLQAQFKLYLKVD